MKATLTKSPADTSASLAGALLAILSAFEIPSRIGLSPEDMGIILGSLATVAASIRGYFVAKAKKESQG